MSRSGANFLHLPYYDMGIKKAGSHYSYNEAICFFNEYVASVIDL